MNCSQCGTYRDDYRNSISLLCRMCVFSSSFEVCVCWFVVRAKVKNVTQNNFKYRHFTPFKQNTFIRSMQPLICHSVSNRLHELTKRAYFKNRHTFSHTHTRVHSYKPKCNSHKATQNQTEIKWQWKPKNFIMVWPPFACATHTQIYEEKCGNIPFFKQLWCSSASPLLTNYLPYEVLGLYNKPSVLKRRKCQKQLAKTEQVSGHEEEDREWKRRIEKERERGESE